VSTRYGSPATGTRDRFARPMIVRQRRGTGRAIDTPPTAVIFMSFAGSDAAAAETVTTALKAAGHRVWRFTEGVRGGSDWYEEMLGQVVRCDVVVFLASRASAGSEFCRIELECARDHNRRIVVVRLDDLAGADLPAPARTIKRLDLDDTREFAARLGEAVTTDFDLVHALADLDERATNWDRRERPARLLARGGELRTFERLITTTDARPSATAGLRPTQTTRDYVLHGRKRQRARTRAVTAAVLVVALAVGTIVTISTRIVSDRDRGEVATQLLDRAAAARATDPLRALRFGIAADHLHPDSATRASLVATMTSTRYRGTLAGGGATAAAGRPLVATASRAGAQLWDVTDPARARPAGTAPTADRTPTSELAFSPDGRRLAVGAAYGAVVVYDTDALTGDPATPPTPLLTTDPREQQPGSITPATDDIAFAPNGDLVVVATGDAVPQVWDLRERQRVATLPRQRAGVSVAAFAPDGDTVATGDADGTVTLWDVRDPRATRPTGPPLPRAGSAISGLAFSGRLLVVGSYGGPTRVWDVGGAPTLVGKLGDAGEAASAVAVSPVAPVVAIGSLDGTTRLWSIADPRAPIALGDPMAAAVASVRSARFSADGTFLVTGSDGGTSVLWTTADSAEPHTLGPPVTSENQALSFVTFSADGRVAALSGVDRSAQLFDVTDPAAPRPVGLPFTPAGTTVFDAAFAPYGRILATATENGVTLWDTANPTQPRRLGEPPVPGFTSETISVRFSPDGRILAAVVSDGTVRLWDVGNPASPAELGAPITGKLASVAFSANGSVLAVGSYDSTIRLYDISRPGTPEPVTPSLPGPPVFRGTVASLAFSRHGVLASGSDNGTVILWDVSAPARITTVGQPIDAASAASASAVTFTSDADLLITASDTGTVTVRDVTDPAVPVALGRPLAAHHSAAESLTVTPDGRTIATGSYDGAVVFIDLARLLNLRDHAHEDACTLAGSGFSPDDWARFVPRRPYEPTCPH
jgi:WD40 repeat protein